MIRRDFSKLFAAAILQFSQSSYCGDVDERDSVDKSNEFDEVDSGPDRILFKKSQNTQTEKIIKKPIPILNPNPIPLWISRGKEEFKIDVSTDYGYKVSQWALRDIQAGRMGYPDPTLLKTLSKAQVALATHNLLTRFDVTSGIRTIATNNKTEGAARSSLHLPGPDGMFFAVDFRAIGFDALFTAKLMSMAGMHGIGLYLTKDFVHADTGSFRRWIKK